MLSDESRKIVQWILNEFGPEKCDFCDWEARTVDETLQLLVVEVGGKKNKSACPICFDRMYPNFNGRVCDNTMEGK